VVNLKENVEIVVQSGIKQRIVNLKRTKMAAKTEEVTTFSRKIQVMAILHLLSLTKVILRAIVSN
jgi:hypothetical protein